MVHVLVLENQTSRMSGSRIKR